MEITFVAMIYQTCTNAVYSFYTPHTSNCLSVTDTTPPRKQVTANNMVRNCIFAIVTAVQVQVDAW